MARTRNIKPGFFSNEDLASIHPYGRLLFLGLWGIADRRGRLERRVRRIHAELFPYEPDVPVEELLRQLEDLGFVRTYQADGVTYLSVVNFHKHQNPHPREAESVIPAPQAEAMPRHCLGNAKALPSRASYPILPSTLPPFHPSPTEPPAATATPTVPDLPTPESRADGRAALLRGMEKVASRYKRNMPYPDESERESLDTLRRTVAEQGEDDRFALVVWAHYCKTRRDGKARIGWFCRWFNDHQDRALKDATAGSFTDSEVKEIEALL